MALKDDLRLLNVKSFKSIVWNKKQLAQTSNAEDNSEEHTAESEDVLGNLLKAFEAQFEEDK